MGQLCQKYLKCTQKNKSQVQIELNNKRDTANERSQLDGDCNALFVKETAMQKEAEQAAVAEVLINNLPCEMLDLIFSYLSIEDHVKTERVCKTWRLIGTEQHWREPKSLSLDKWEWSKNGRITDGILAAVLLRCGPNVRFLQVTNTNGQLTGRVLKIICHQCRNLVSIDIRLPNTDLPKNCLEGFGECCKKLKVVHLQYDGSKQLLFRSFFEKCLLLETMDLSGKNLCPKGKEIKAINRDLKNISLNCYCYLKPVFLKKLKKRCDAIETLQFGNFCNYKFVTPDLLITTLLHYSKSLLSLNLHQCREDKMFVLLEEFAKLKSLFMSWVCDPQDIRSGFGFAVPSKNIRLFHAFDDKWNLDNHFLHKVLAQNEHLQSLCVLNCSVSADVLMICKKYAHSMRHIVFERIKTSCKATHFCELLTSLSNLETLIFIHCDIKLNDTLVKTLATSCEKLKTLYIIWPFVTDEGLSAISSLSCLTHVNLKGLEHVSDKGIGNLAALGRLEVLDISRCLNLEGTLRSDPNFKITDESCILLARNCPEFRILYAEGVINLTNNLVNAFCESIQVGYLNHAVTLNLRGTLVTWKYKKHERLEVKFGELELI